MAWAAVIARPFRSPSELEGANSIFLLAVGTSEWSETVCGPRSNVRCPQFNSEVLVDTRWDIVANGADLRWTLHSFHKQNMMASLP